MKKIVLKTSESAMLEMLEFNSKIIKVIDNGHTQIPANSLTVICLSVDTKDNMILKHPKISEMRLL